MNDETLAERLAHLSPDARASLSRRLAVRRGQVPHQTIPRREPGTEVPLSFAQWRLWFLEQLRPGTHAWNTPVAVLVRGPLDTLRLQGAFQELIERHGTLRTVFASRSGKAELSELHDVRFELPLAQADGDDTEAEIRRFVDIEVRRPFNLEQDLMLRASVLRIASEVHVLVLVAHHIACDGWSKALLLRDLAAFYAGRGSELPGLEIDYGDFAIWQRQQLSGEALEELKRHWSEVLAGAPDRLEIPTDRPRPPLQELQGAVEWLAVEPGLARDVVELGRKRRATPFMTFLAAFAVTIMSRTEQDELLVGSPSAMRTLPELESLVGLFANTLVYRVDMTGLPAFIEVLDRVRQTAFDVYRHQELPFEKIVEAVSPPRDPTRNPLVQVNMRLEGVEPRLELEGVECEPVALDPGIARFDVALELGETGDGYAGYLEYNTALFEPRTATRLASDFIATLRAVVAEPERPVDELVLRPGSRNGQLP